MKCQQLPTTTTRNQNLAEDYCTQVCCRVLCTLYYVLLLTSGVLRITGHRKQEVLRSKYVEKVEVIKYQSKKSCNS